MEISAIQPQALWTYFYELCQIPRPSKHEEQVLAYLQNFAKAHKLAWDMDATGNMLIRKKATAGEENRPIIILQAHVDMVCEKNSDVKHDFLNDPILARLEGAWVKAEGTTLGADNGIGLAAMLALLADTTLTHGPLECLFTVDEESGLTGAAGLTQGFLKGGLLINLDSEDDGEIYVGCAGGRDTCASLELVYDEVPAHYFPFKIEMKGLKGGHSGDDIHKGRANALRLMAQFVQNWKKCGHSPILISHFEGGNLRNAIPREAVLCGFVAPELKEQLRIELNHYIHEVEKSYAQADPTIDISLQSAALGSSSCLSSVCSEAIVEAILALPNGMIEMSALIPGLVQTSTNLASLRMNDKQAVLVSSQRSDQAERKEALCKKMKLIFEKYGFEVTQSEGYPGWSPKADSYLLQVAQEQHISLFGKEALVKAVHAGLECGLILEKYPHLDMISIGPTIREVHSPDEAVEVITVERFWHFLKHILAHI